MQQMLSLYYSPGLGRISKNKLLQHVSSHFSSTMGLDELWNSVIQAQQALGWKTKTKRMNNKKVIQGLVGKVPAVYLLESGLQWHHHQVSVTRYLL